MTGILTVITENTVVSLVMAKTTMSVPWSEGSPGDFSDLHEAIRSGTTERFSSADQSETPPEVPGEDGFSDSEDDDEVEAEPSPDDHGEFVV